MWEFNRWSYGAYRYGSQATGDFIVEHSIYGDFDDIESKWDAYYDSKSANLLIENCADAMSRFLTEFAYIPQPESSLTHNFSFNYVFAGVLWWPSFIPAPITPPGRVMDNANYHLKKQEEFIKAHKCEEATDEEVLKKRYLLQSFNNALEDFKNHSSQISDLSDRNKAQDLHSNLFDIVKRFEEGNIYYSDFKNEVERQLVRHDFATLRKYSFLRSLGEVYCIIVNFLSNLFSRPNSNKSLTFSSGANKVANDMSKLKKSLPRGLNT